MHATRPERPTAGRATLVFIGGAAGTAARQGAALVVPVVDGFPWPIVAVNVVGAFLLGALLAVLLRAPSPRRRRLRLLLGTGFLGGFTTYSALATDTALLVGNGAAWLGLAYGVGTVVAGGVATWLGIVVGSARQEAAA